eukprot:11084241-Alexandrium_andersonii.AAC.1
MCGPCVPGPALLACPGPLGSYSKKHSSLGECWDRTQVLAPPRARGGPLAAPEALGQRGVPGHPWP